MKIRQVPGGLLAAWLMGMLLLAACGSPTGLDLSLSYAEDLGLERLRVRASVDGTTFPAEVLPRTDRPLHPNEESVVLLFPDVHAGSEVTVLIEGLVGEAVVASERHGVVLLAGELVAADVRLLAMAECGGDDDCEEGQRCDDGSCRCDATSCPDGCCADGSCEAPSLLACGISGASCAACGDEADQCEDGACVCGATGGPCEADQICDEGVCRCTQDTCPDGCCGEDERCHAGDVLACGSGGVACAACGENADRCSDAGVCVCGDDEVACVEGQACQDEACVCTPESCPDGCCDGDVCRVMDADACGIGGGTCTDCDGADTCTESGACSGCAASCDGCCVGSSCVELADVSESACGAGGAGCRACGDDADRCSSETGTCVCGETGARCGAGQRCEGEVCVCDGASCPDGCCLEGLCETSAMATCGVGGQECDACDATRADNCSSDGICACGEGAPCEVGQSCNAGVCGCTRDSCPDGCCDGDACLAGTSNEACGKGRACLDCTEEGAFCEAQVCSGCAAECGGCCDGLDCVTSISVERCGWNGSSCVNCGSRADDCVTGECLCGGGPACDPGQVCEGGNCRCNESSCSGCCQGDTCIPLGEIDEERCGAGGESCETCDDHSADNCSANGNCRCGNAAACGDGLQCVSGSCVCNTTSGCSGCCSDDECKPGTERNTCGSGGETCQDCQVLIVGGQCNAQSCGL